MNKEYKEKHKELEDTRHRQQMEYEEMIKSNRGRAHEILTRKPYALEYAQRERMRKNEACGNERRNWN